MPLEKVTLTPGVNKESTSFSNEGTWYDCDKVRFRQTLPEKIGGWTRISVYTFLGVCRSLFNWVTLVGTNLLGVGTHLKFYIGQGGDYFDITPIRATVALTDPYTTTSGSAVVTVTDAAGGYTDGDYVTFSGGSDVAGLDLNNEYAIDIPGTSTTTFNITAATTANASTTGGGSVSAAYQINVGSEAVTPLTGWGAAAFGAGTWGSSGTSQLQIRLWSQSNFGEDLLFCPRSGGIYYWDSSVGTGTRAVELSTMVGADNVPTVASQILVSDVSRFVFAFGCNDYGSSVQDRLLVRWSDQETAVSWYPAATNQAGSIRLSKGTAIVTATQSRQEILVWTNTSLYTMQYVGAPVVWGTQIVGENISIVGPNAVAYANGTSFWMGIDKFYVYDGILQQLPCSLRRFVFSDINYLQMAQVFASTVEAYHEIWWFYPSTDSTTCDKYVVYNYMDSVWYHGTMDRSAWLDSGLRTYPLAATYSNNLVNHEEGVDDNETGTPAAISAHIESAQFDIDDGSQMSLVSRIIPDITFDGSDADSPVVTLSLIPQDYPGAALTTPASTGDVAEGTVTRTATSL